MMLPHALPPPDSETSEQRLLYAEWIARLCPLVVHQRLGTPDAEIKDPPQRLQSYERFPLFSLE